MSYSIYTLSEENSTYWIFIREVEKKVDARTICDEFHKASGDFCTRVLQGKNEIIIPRERMVKNDIWS